MKYPYLKRLSTILLVLSFIFSLSSCDEIKKFFGIECGIDFMANAGALSKEICEFRLNSYVQGASAQPYRIVICPGEKVSLYWRSRDVDGALKLYVNGVFSRTVPKKSEVPLILELTSNSKLELKADESDCHKTSIAIQVDVVRGPTEFSMFCSSTNLVGSMIGSIPEGTFGERVRVYEINPPATIENLVPVVDQSYYAVCVGNEVSHAFFRGTHGATSFDIFIPRAPTTLNPPIAPTGTWNFDFAGTCSGLNQVIFNGEFKLKLTCEP